MSYAFGTSCLLQIRDEYEAVKDSKAPEQPAAKRAAVANGAAPSLGGATEVVTAAEDGASGRSTTARLLDSIAAERPRSAYSSSAMPLSSCPGWSHCICIRMPETAAACVPCMCICMVLTSESAKQQLCKPTVSPGLALQCKRCWRAAAACGAWCYEWCSQ